MQEKLQDQEDAKGASLLGVVLSSDKTNISVMTGGTVAHPLYLSLANLPMKYRLKASTNANVLLALIPVPTYPKKLKKIASLLENRLTHQALDTVLFPLKQAAQWGKMLTDPRGYNRLCFTLLASCIVDTPESTMIAGVGGNSSSVTKAYADKLGDSFKHSARVGKHTLKKIRKLGKLHSPWKSIREYLAEAKAMRLNRVHRPFWRNWEHAEPSIFLTPEPLHHWHKMFWDHDRKWCTNALGEQEINFRFSVLQPHTGFRHFKKGIVGLKQVTGREHRDMQRYIVAVIADAAPPELIIAVRSLITFRYLGQASQMSDSLLQLMESALQTFHEQKDSIVELGLRKGESGKVLEHWRIPKLEFMQSVVSNVEQNGVPMQWTTDATERAHKDLIKENARKTNNKDHEAQICRALDRAEKCRMFDQAIAIREAEEDEDNYESEEESLSFRSDPSHLRDPSGQSLDYFDLSILVKKAHEKALESEQKTIIPTPLRTFSSPFTAFHLSRAPTWKRSLVSEVANKFKLPDLEPALVEYVSRLDERFHQNLVVGAKRATQEDSPQLPFLKLEVWKSFKIQSRQYFPPHEPLPTRTIHALPPGENKDWPNGRYEAGILNIDHSKDWPQSGLKGALFLYDFLKVHVSEHCVSLGHQIVEAKLIFRIAGRNSLPNTVPDDFLVYAQKFDIIPQVNFAFSGTKRQGPYPESNSGLHLLKRAVRNDNLVGDIVPLSRFRCLVDLVPRFGSKADERLDSNNAILYSTQFWLNSYFEKDLFYCLSDCP